MTKAERLQELQLEEKLYKELDKFFDAGWREFVKNNRRKNSEANEEVYDMLTEIKGKEFSDDVRGLMKDIKEQYALLTVVEKPEGTAFNDSRYTTIPKVWVKQKSGSAYHEDSSKGHTGSLCIQVTDDRWIRIDYQN